MAKRMKGYTLIEMMVTLAIVGVGATLLMPGMSRAKENAQKSACLSNLRQIGQASLLYNADRQTILPWCTKTGTDDIYWWIALAPYVGTNTSVFRCPSDKNFTKGYEDRTVSYGWNYKLTGHGDTGVDGEGKPRNDFVRIPSYSKPSQILIASDGPGGWDSLQEDSWGYIDERVEHTADPKRHAGTGNALFLDGHVESRPTTDFPNNPLFQNRTLNQQ